VATNESNGRRTSEWIPVADLKPHPRNYKQHPDEQIDEIIKSIDEIGQHKPIVIARDNTILAGHGFVKAVAKMGMFGPGGVDAIRLDLEPDDPRALKVLVGDNELGGLAEKNDRMLMEILKDVLTTTEDIGGTGFDMQSFAAAVMVSRPIEEIRDKNEAAEWIGMPEFDSGAPIYRLTIMCGSEEDRKALIDKIGIRVSDTSRDGKACSAWWPPREMQDRISVLFVEEQPDLLTGL
jgi:hypothetical protein